MTREIKFEYGFQSINGIVKKHYYLHEIPSIKEKCDVWGVLPFIYARQFTGLKDKNGVDIYEGDIHKDEQCDLFKVIRMECGRYALELISSNYIDDCIDWSEVEIIGNIHQPKNFTITETKEIVSSKLKNDE